MNPALGASIWMGGLFTWDIGDSELGGGLKTKRNEEMCHV